MRRFLLASLALSPLAAGPPPHLNTISYPVFTVFERAVRADVRVKLAYFAEQVDFGTPGRPEDPGPPPPITEAMVRAREEKLVALVEPAIHVEVNGEPVAARFEELAIPTRGGEGNPNDGALDDLRFRFRFEAPAPVERVRIRYELFASHDPNHRGIAKIRAGVAERAFVFTRGAVFESTVEEIRSAGPWSAMASFFLLGMEHIFTGYDHLMFLAGLLLVAASLRSMFWVVTGFTIAHSVTLVAAALRWVSLSPSIVEPAIAASVVFVGIENLVRGGESKRRWLLASAFGLVHGLGFAGFVNEVELPPGGTALCLASFNVGVEAGQATVVCLVFPLLAWARDKWPSDFPKFVRLGSLGIAAAGAYWLVTRLV